MSSQFSRNTDGGLFALVAGAVLSVIFAQPAAALPSYAAQTGEECAACHVGGFGPQLTQHGRIFKLQGYGATQSWAKADLARALPLSAMAIANFTHTSHDQTTPPADHFHNNDNVALQEASIFVAGRLAPGVGSFVQATYSGVDRNFALDNVDLRYAREVKLGGRDAVLGATLNNNPTVQDVWNTTPAWSFPYTSSDLAPGRPAAPLIADGLGQQVAGLTGYLWLDDHLYLELGGYGRLGADTLDALGLEQETYLQGVAPYWRLAFSGGKGGTTYSAGVFGLSAKVRPDPLDPATDRYTDVGLDATWQKKLPKNAVASVNAAWIHEARKLDASFDAGDAADPRGHLDSFTADASYYWDRRWGLTLGLFDVTGSTDPTLFAPEEGVGSRVGRPNTSGFTLQADWTPFGQEGSWGAPYANLRLGVQYTDYFKFGGASHDYDGFGRSAHDNNTLSVFLWTAF